MWEECISTRSLFKQTLKKISVFKDPEKNSNFFLCNSISILNKDHCFFCFFVLAGPTYIWIQAKFFHMYRSHDKVCVCGNTSYLKVCFEIMSEWPTEKWFLIPYEWWQNIWKYHVVIFMVGKQVLKTFWNSKPSVGHERIPRTERKRGDPLTVIVRMTGYHLFYVHILHQNLGILTSVSWRVPTPSILKYIRIRSSINILSKLTKTSY